MASRTKNPDTQRQIKLIKSARKALDLQTRAAFLSENVGREIQHKDRTYKITPKGNWVCITAKEDIIRNSSKY